MKTEKILKIWKEIIYIAWFYKDYLEKDKQKIEKKLLSYKQELSWSENIYSKKLIFFIDDLLWDLAKNKPLQIDILFEDDFIWNYYDSSKQVNFYNSLIDLKIYKKIITNENKIENNKLFINLYKNFEKNFLELKVEKISNLLLIFTIFKIISPKKYLSRLFDFRKKIWLSYENTKKLIKMIKSYEYFLNKLYKISLKNLETKNFSYKYIKISKQWEEKDFQLNFILEDASKYDFRTWNHLYEYKNLIKNLKKI